MSQISPPIRILIVGAIAFLAVWMLLLRPGGEEVVPTAATPEAPATAAGGAPAQTGLGKAVEAGNNAAAAADAAASGLTGEAASSAASATSSAGATAPVETQPAGKLDAKTLAALPAATAKAIRKNQVVALLFWNPKAADDRAVKRELGHIDRFDGQVAVQTANVRSISNYGPITRGVDVEQSPTVVVVDPKRNAEALVGYVDRFSIQQAVVDALLSTNGSLVKDPYLRKIDRVCASVTSAGHGIPHASTKAEANVTMARLDQLVTRWTRQIAAVPAPAKWRGLSARFTAENKRLNATVSTAERKFHNANSTSQMLAALAPLYDLNYSKQVENELNRHGVYACSGMTGA